MSADRNDTRNDGETGFLSRWSQRKRAVQREREEGAEAQAGTDPQREEEAAEAKAETARIEEANQAAAEAVDLETLEFESDYSVFLKDGVSKQLKNAALRKLWRSNPVLACVDGLNDYDQDFRTVEPLVGALKSSWQVGNGYGWMEERDKAETAAKAVADADAPALDAEAAVAPSDDANVGQAEGEAGPEPQAETLADAGASQPLQGEAIPDANLAEESGRPLAGPVREGAADRQPDQPPRPARKRMRFS
ncbi:DUF3306 domain-containing protein [Stappia stellulata]|uniref:DUF3306 domain-containing protein n=1 Tax=Stappia stellulata TaxID=71235 RepID=UPI000422339A|nr:DUF3306 domain-containing protein [Stappia stellulata]